MSEFTPSRIAVIADEILSYLFTNLSVDKDSLRAKYITSTDDNLSLQEDDDLKDALSLLIIRGFIRSSENTYAIKYVGRYFISISSFLKEEKNEYLAEQVKMSTITQTKILRWQTWIIGLTLLISLIVGAANWSEVRIEYLGLKVAEKTFDRDQKLIRLEQELQMKNQELQLLQSNLQLLERSLDSLTSELDSLKN